MTVTAISHNEYNALPTLEEAQDQSIGDLPLALQTLGDVLLRHQMEDRLWVALHHKHWPIRAHEIAVLGAPVTTDEDERAWTFSPLSNASGAPLCLGTNDQGGIAAYEYTLDPYVAAQPAFNHSFLQDLAEAIRANRLEGRFGVVADRLIRPGYALVEHTIGPRTCVLREEPSSRLEDYSLLETSWSVRRSAGMTSCRTACMSYCTVSRLTRDHAHGHTVYHDPHG